MQHSTSHSGNSSSLSTAAQEERVFRITTEVRTFDHLREMTVAEISASQDEACIVLRQISDLTRHTMEVMNAHYPGLPPDSFERTIELSTNPGAKVVLFKGSLVDHPEAPIEILGYGIVICGRDNIPDRYHIPPELLESEKASRIIRLFVTETAREHLPRGEAFTALVDAVKLLVGSGPGIGMVLTDLAIEGSPNEQPTKKKVWLEANEALLSRGFDDTGKSLVEKVPTSDGLAVAIQFKWYVWPAHSDEAKQRLASLARKNRVQRLDAVSRSVHVSASVPEQGATILALGGPKQGYDLAQFFPGNTVCAPLFTPLKRREVAPNLIRGELSNVATPNTYDSVAVIGAIPDLVASVNAQSSFAELLTSMKSVLKDRGSLVIRDSVKPEDFEAIVECRCSKLLDSRLKTSIAEAFRDFFTTRSETHIEQKLWDLVREGERSDEHQAWYAPRLIVEEFNRKYPFRSDWNRERKRSYTLLSAQEIQQGLTTAGFRINYAQPLSPLAEALTFLSQVNQRSPIDKLPVARGSGYNVFIAEKVNEGAGVRIVPVKSEEVKGSFLQIESYFGTKSKGPVMEYQEIGVRRGKAGELVTVDAIPFTIRASGGVSIQIRETPRPLLSLDSHSPDGASNGSYHLEQLGAVVQKDDAISNEQIAKIATQIAQQRGGITESLSAKLSPSTYFTAPFLFDELVHSQPLHTTLLPEWSSTATVYQLSTHPRSRTVQGSNYLLGTQSGVFQDGRMERELYRIYAEFELDPGVWLGNVLNPSMEVSQNKLLTIEKLLAPEHTVTFELAPTPIHSAFTVQRTRFEERDSQNATVGSAELESLVPHSTREHSGNYGALLPLAWTQGENSQKEPVIGVIQGAFASVQKHTQNSALYTLPIFPVPRRVQSLQEMAMLCQQEGERVHGIKAENSIEQLGGKYRLSPGNTPALMWLYCAAVSSVPHSSLHWIKLSEALSVAHKLQCGQLRLAVYRAAHMFGLFSQHAQE